MGHQGSTMIIRPVTATLFLEKKRWIPVSLRRWSLKPVRSAAFRRNLDFLDGSMRLTLARMTTTLFLAIFPPLVQLKKLQSEEWEGTGSVLGQASEDGERLKGVRRQSCSSYRSSLEGQRMASSHRCPGRA